MANWELIYQILNNADNDKFDDEVNRHIQCCTTYDYDDEDRILVFDTYNGMKAFENILKERLEIPEDEQYIYGEPYEGWYIEYAVGGEEFYAFSDSGFCCENCGKWHYYNEYGPANYHIWDGCILCDECIRENEEFAEDYIDDIKVTYDNNDCTHCNTILSRDALEDMGWEKYNLMPYENGMYGREDNPKQIAETIWKNLGNEMEILFDLDSCNPFATYYNVWIREVA